MDEHMSLQEHLLKIKDIGDQLEAIGRTMKDEDMVVITLKSLPSSHEHFIETLTNTATNVDHKFPDLCTKLLRQDHWKQQFGSSAPSSSSKQASSAQSFLKDKGPSQSFDQSQNSSKKKQIRCNHCHKFGLVIQECKTSIAFEQQK